MASKSFTLADSPEGGGKGPCAKLCLCTCVLAFVVILGAVGVYVYQTYGTVCSAPELDENGLSNWTYRGVDHIAFACFPGFFLEGESDLVVGQCVNGTWNVAPACNKLPIRIDCHVNNQSIIGNITMWQHQDDEPTHIYGRIDYTLAMKTQGQLMEQVIISKRTCNVSHHNVPKDPSELHPHPEPKRNNKQELHQTSTTQLANTDEEEKDENDNTHETDEEEGSSEEEEDKENPAHRKILKIQFKDSQLKAYKKTDLFINIIFVDHKTTARLVSVHQANLTLVMTSEDPVHSLNSSWSWDKEKKTRGLIF